MQVTLVLHAMDIPNNTPVRKLTGEVVYTLKKELTVYSDMPEQRQTLKGDDVVFLVGGHSNVTINAYPATQKFAVDLSIDEAMDLLSDLASQ